MDTLEISLKWTNQKDLKKEELLRLKKCPEPSGMGSIFNTFLTLPSSLKQWKKIRTLRHTEISHQCKHRKFIPISFINGMEIKSWKQLESKIYIYLLPLNGSWKNSHESLAPRLIRCPISLTDKEKTCEYENYIN